MYDITNRQEYYTMERTKVTEEELEQIKKFIEEIRFGSVTVIVQDGKIVQIEKHEKVRMNSRIGF